jgi:amidase
MANAFTDDILGVQDATSIAEGIRRGDYSAEEVVRAAVERVRRINPVINAVAAERFTEAIAEADNVTGPFAGIPIFLKDQVNMKGLPTLHGSRAVPGTPHKKNDAGVDQILSTGVVVLGKSTSSEMGVLPCGETLLHGNTLNPCDTGFSTGGSSAGSAALVASGAVPIAHAMDGGGSIRIPASCCGLVGMKPSRHRHKDMFTKVFPVDFAEMGIVSRSVRDTANYFAAIEQFHRAKKLPAIGKVEGPGRKRLRIGLYTETLTGVQCDSDVSNTAKQAGELCRKLGHEVELIRNPFSMQFKLDFTTFYSMVSFASKNFGFTEFGFGYKPALMEPFTKYFANMFPVLFAANLNSINRLRRFNRKYERAFENFDLLVCPTLAIKVPEIGYWDPSQDVKETSYRLSTCVNSTIVQNISGAPAISLPLGTCSNGLPCGVQFAAKRGQERMLLELAFELEEAGVFMPYLYDQLETGKIKQL